MAREFSSQRMRIAHSHSLAERLLDPRIIHVIQPILAGDSDAILGESDPDVLLAMDLGLIVFDNGWQIANPIYREVLIRTLNINYQQSFPAPEFHWEKPNGDLNLEALFTEFQAFWRENGDMWELKSDYIEVFPQLLLMAFFQRVLNGGAKLTREAAAGRERIDMLIEWKGFKHIIEIKLVLPKRSRATTLQKGLLQTASYAQKVGLDSTQTLAIFDRTPKGRKMSWAKRLRREQHGNVTVWWM